MVRRLFDANFSLLVYNFAVGLLPSLKKIWKLRLFPKKVEKFFINLMQQSIDLRRSQSNDRVDFLNYLLQLQDKKQLSTPEMTSHVMTFMTDGFLTTAAVITHFLLLLARDPIRQEKLRKEILENLEANGGINFEKLNDLPYLDAGFHEALRIFSPLLIATKICTVPYEFIDKNGKPCIVNKGDIVFLPIHSIHHDEQIYENPEEFVPERFLPENGGVKAYRERGEYLGFGDGPRVCLGMRFALTQSKAVIVEIVKNFNIKPNPKTRTDNYLNPKSFLAELDGGVWLDFEARN